MAAAVSGAVDKNGGEGKTTLGGNEEDDNNNRERSLFQFEGMKLTLEELINEWNARVTRREELLKKCGMVQYDEFERLVKARKLDCNLKKCTAFVRKLRQFSESSRPTITADIRNLNLTKYISEIAGVVGELKLKPGEVSSLVQVCSEIHTRYRDFSPQLLEQLGNVLLGVKDLTTCSTKLATDLRLFGELLLAGILAKEEGTRLLLEIVQHLISLDKDGSQLIPVFVAFLRDQTDELVGVLPRDLKLALEEHACQGKLKREHSSVLGSEDQGRLKATLKKYFVLVKNIRGKKNDKVWGSAKALRKLMETKGDVPPERLRLHTELADKLEKYHGAVGKLANLLDLSAPKLRILSIDPDEEFEKALQVAGEGEGGEEPLFEDEETRQFYQELPDLATYIFEKKNGLLKNKEESKEDDDAEDKKSVKSDDDKDSELNSSSDNLNSSLDCDELDSESESDSEESLSFDLDLEKAELMQEEELSPLELEGDTLPSELAEAEPGASAEEDVPSSSSCATTPRLKFGDYLANLKNCVNRRLIDKAAFEFVDNFKSKRCKMELARHLFALPRQRMDLLRLCSRLTATLSQIYPEIGQEICNLLQRDFRFLVLKRDQHRLDTKLKVTRYIGELTQFSVFPKNEAFTCFKLLLRNFTHHQVEMTCCFLETCGRFLYKSRDSCRKMKLYLEEMLRRKSTQFLEPRYAYQVDCAYHVVCSSSGSSCIPKKVKTPLHAFMDYVLIYDLNRDTLERANKSLRMFDWKDPAKTQMVTTILSSPWRLNTSQLDTAAALLTSLKQFRPKVVQAVIENISEVVRLGCEFESEDLNNMRMSTCQYFAHLYNYKCINTTSLLNVMYYLISYGVTYDNTFSKMDPPDSLCRIRIICFMLRIVGDFVSTPRSNKRLDFFLKYFQRYFLYKKGLPLWGDGEGRRFPCYVEEMFEDTVKRVRGKWKFRKTVEEAEEDILELDRKLREKVKRGEVKRAISGERNGVAVKLAGEQVQIPQKEKPVNYAKVVGIEANKVGLEVVEEEEEEEEDDLDDFEKEFRALCNEGGKTETRKKQDCPLTAYKFGGGSAESGMTALQHGMDRVKVTVLTKENNRPKEKLVEIGGKEEFLLQIKQRDEQEKREKLEVKSRTLLLSRRQQEEEQMQNDKKMMEALGKLGKVQIGNIGGGTAVAGSMNNSRGKGKGKGGNRRGGQGLGQQQYKN